jgi:hypothetical protein
MANKRTSPSTPTDTKRQKVEEERSALVILVDAEMKVWGEKLKALSEKKAKYRLCIYPPAGAGYRYTGLEHIYREFRMSLPWTYEKYIESRTSHWEDPIVYYADTFEELLPCSPELLFIVGVNFFVVRSGEYYTPREAQYERPHARSDMDLTKARFNNELFDPTKPEDVSRIFERAKANIRDLVWGGNGLKEHAQKLKLDLAKLRDQVAKLESEALNWFPLGN